MTEFRVSEAAALLGVSDDTVRRWAEHGRLALRKAANGMQVVDGADLVPLMEEASSGGALDEAFPLAPLPGPPQVSPSSTASRPRRIPTRCSENVTVAAPHRGHDEGRT
ncbi:excisionase family DNA-binding protein, partial [Agromyces humi]|uniref:excisionase family DNA-binding protein n=1 Tax=Agromyces humi TaxID=1766800 RepID=UPI001F3CC254